MVRGAKATRTNKVFGRKLLRTVYVGSQNRFLVESGWWLSMKFTLFFFINSFVFLFFEKSMIFFFFFFFLSQSLSKVFGKLMWSLRVDGGCFFVFYFFKIKLMSRGEEGHQNKLGRGSVQRAAVLRSPRLKVLGEIGF